jgi:hypothetical protein
MHRQIVRRDAVESEQARGRVNCLEIIEFGATSFSHHKYWHKEE